MKRIIAVILILLLGLSVISYPSLSNYLAELNGSRVMQNYDQAVSDKDSSDLQAEWDAAETYNQNLTGSPVHDPFLEGSGMAMSEDYTSVLDVDGVMGYLEIPKISVNLPIYHGTSDDVLRKGVGHLEGSTLPIGGVSRHAVLTGHSGLVQAKLFTDLIRMQIGDMFYIHVLGQTLAYQVDQIKVVEPNDTSDLVRVAGEDYCTLLTCTPYGVNSHRLLVRGTRVDYVPEVKEAIQPEAGSAADHTILTAAAITSAVMLGLIVVTVVVSRRRSKKKRPEGQSVTKND